MQKYKVIVPCEMQGYLRYGHGEITIEADTKTEALEKAFKLAEKHDFDDVICDDYSIDYCEYDLDNMTIKEVTLCEEN